MSHQFNFHSTAEEVAKVFGDEIKGKNVLITGASPKGLGAEAARVIAKYAGLVILAGRNQTKLEQTAADIKKETPAANIRLLIIDLNSLASVRKAAAEVNAYTEPIHVLINNAAIMAVPYGTTEDGFESQFGANHVAHFLFTSLIFPRLVAAGTSAFPARVVNISSLGHAYSPIRFDDLRFSEGKAYEPIQAYGQSKTANILMANEIARRAREKGIHVLAYSLHPGGILTPLGQHLTDDYLIAAGWKTADGQWDAKITWKTLGEGASTYIVAGFDPTIKDKSGAYLQDGHIDEEARQPHAAKEEDGRKLWALSEKLVGQEFVI